MRTTAQNHGLRRLTTLLLLVAVIVYMNGCGGGDSAGKNASAASSAPNTQQAADLATAQKVYTGTPRTPAGFYADPAPVGVTGTVATMHLKNSDLAGAPVGAAAYELCNDDMAMATAWSEGKSTFMGSYADLVDVTGNARYWELTRVPRADVSARLRHRVFKCSYVNRSGLDPATDSGPAGTLNLRPLDAASLKDLTEYLWYFTAFDNADHVVLDSAAGTAPSGSLAHVITMARLTRAAISGDCDRIDVLRWTHSANTSTGSLSRQLDTLQTIRARRVNGLVELCAS
jgi:FlaG/FlaF family flagellin (archaellin)